MGAKRQIKKLRAEVSSLAKGAGAPRAEGPGRGRMLKDMRERLSSMERKADKMGAQIATLEDTNRSLRAENRSLKEENASLRAAGGRARRPDR